MYRAYHAIRGLTGPDGRSTNAVYGFVTMLRKILADHSPEFIAVAWDLAGPTFRDELVSDYKANRSPMPPDLVEQVPLIHEALSALGIPVLAIRRFEADDVMGTIAQRAAEAGYDVALVTGDKDFFQLVGGPISVYNPRDDGTWFDAAGVKDEVRRAARSGGRRAGADGRQHRQRQGRPRHRRERRARSDRDARLARRAARGGADAHAEAVSRRRSSRTPTRRDRAASWSRSAPTCRSSSTSTAYRHRPPDRAKAFELFSRLGFRTLAPEYAPVAATAANVNQDYDAIETPERLDDWIAGAAAGRPCRAPSRARFAVGDARAHRRPLALARSVSGPLHPDRSLQEDPPPHRPRRPWISFSFEDDGCALPVGDTDGSPVPALPTSLKALLEDASVRKIGHDLKAATIVLARHGVALGGFDTDTELVSYVVDATRSSHTIDSLAVEELSYRPASEEELRGKGVKAQAFANLPIGGIVPFACERVDLVGQLAPRLRATDARRPVSTGSTRASNARWCRCSSRSSRRVSASMRRCSASRRTKLNAELESRAARIYEMAGETFNINSPKQLGDILFTKLKLPALKRTGKARTASTAQDVLEELALVHDLPREVLEWRALQKLKGTYVDALPQLVDPDTGRVHTCFSQTTAATGRLSSSDPNLQNVPIRTEVGREIRRAFIADPGSRPDLRRLFTNRAARAGASLGRSEPERRVPAARRHSRSHGAQGVRRRRAGSIPHELRRRAKIINYALLYGKTAFTLAKDIGVTPQAAQEFIDAYFAGFPGRTRLSRSNDRRRAQDRHRLDAVRPAPARARREQSQRPGPRRRRACRRQHADPGHGRRHPEARDDRSPRRARHERSTRLTRA